MDKPLHNQLKVINMLDCLDYLSELEAKDTETEYIRGSRRYKNGKVTIKQRLWELITRDQYGNQQFTNDCFYRWTDVTNHTTHADVQTFLKHFGKSVNKGKHEDDDFVLFEVCW